ncbi:MAG: tRNA (adenosine(37)-N6)-dimethylallyltransferase MiaA [Chitinophagaceae bacterium]|nr:tRNA (adenosine(37)-N6)-dimethylallyltransferase MiaA [Chitinophagaceae bacterium]
MNFTKPTVILVAGPTAVGKTRKAIELALQYKTEIISADSRQCYREMNIGVARPNPEELAAVPHHFIASHSIHDNLNAAWYEKFALDKVNELFTRHTVVVMVGGTGLYIKAFMEGLDEIPETDPVIRASVIRNYEERGLHWLQEEVKQNDPVFFTQGENQNPHRLMRALEVVRSTGKSILSFRKGEKAQRPFDIKMLVMDLPRPQLYERIDQRVDEMVNAGLEEEARGLYAFRHLSALQTVGYQEWFDYFDGNTSREEAITLIKQHTRNYAKRQGTWFRKMGGEA